MMFKVARTSHRGLHRGRPFEGASLRTCDAPPDGCDDWEFDILDADDIERMAEADPVTAEAIAFDEPETDGNRYVNYMWVAQFFTLDELLAFVKIHGKCVIRNDGDMPSIEVYDTYRE